MKILYYFKDRNTPMYQWQHVHIFDELSRHDIEITVHNPLKFSSIEEANDRLLQLVSATKFDLFMTPHNEKDLYLSTLSEIKKKGIPTLLICFDSLTIPFFHKNIASSFDLVWLTSIETKYLFDKWKANSIFLPYAANPYISAANTLENDENRILFIGTPYGSRADMINKLLQADLPVTLVTNMTPSTSAKKSQPILKRYATPIESTYNLLAYPIGRKLLWASIKNKILRQSVLDLNNRNLLRHPSIEFDEMKEWYKRYSLSLSSIANKHTGILKNPVPVINLRSFEIPSSGGVLFSAYTPELAGYFEEGKEAIYYHDNDDMIDKARFYLKDDNMNLRNKIKKQAAFKAAGEHTWYTRFNKIFQELGI